MKRFTETGKWDGTWFRKLKPVQKCLWLYLADRCDQAGVIENDLALASFLIGEPLTVADIAALADNVTVLPNGKLWLPKFVRFQYGILSRDCKPHNAVFAALARHGLLEAAVVAPASSAPTVFTLVPAPDTKTANNQSALGLYQLYPRKQGRAPALRAINQALQTHSYEMLAAAVKAFAAATDKWADHERCFIPHPASWFNAGAYLDDPETWVRVNKTNAKVGMMKEGDHANGF